MIIASGTSQRHLKSLGKYLQEAAAKAGVSHIKQEGSEDSDWVLIDLNSFIVHLFRPEARSVYDLESMWADVHESRQSVDVPELRQQQA
jgi:nicotinate-nucleotide adenylyltransferase/ribosome-associated protein